MSDEEKPKVVSLEIKEIVYIILALSGAGGIFAQQSTFDTRLTTQIEAQRVELENTRRALSEHVQEWAVLRQQLAPCLAK